MGLVHMGVPPVIFEWLNELDAYHSFIETGTFVGNTTFEAAKQFRNVYSIELAEEYYLKAQERFINQPNIHLIHGDSSRELPKLIKSGVADDSVFWLDAHFCGDFTAGKGRESPIITEVELIVSNCNLPIILIDDARFIAYPHKDAQNLNEYPDLKKILNSLNSVDGYSQILWEDVLISVPNIYYKSLQEKIINLQKLRNQQIEVSNDYGLLWKIKYKLNQFLR